MGDDLKSNELSAYYGFEEMEIVKLDWGIKALQITDINGDGRNDIVISNNHKSRIEVLIQKEEISLEEAPVAVDPEDADINALEPPTRFNKQPIAVSQKLYSLVCGDLNSDGITDLAFYGEPKGLYVLLQKDRETADETDSKLNWRTRKKINIDDGLLTPYALVCEDLNNDGLDDLALAGRDVIYLILQKADGTLAEPVKYPSTSQLRAIEPADLNADNINDLVMIVSELEKPIHVRFGMPGGQLGPQVQLSAETPWAMEFFDIDSVPGEEVLTVDGVSKRLICYKLVSEIEQETDWPVLFYPLASGQGSADRDLVIGDVDGDGLEDVIVSDPAAAETILYKQTDRAGLSEPAKFPSFADVTNLSAVDIEGDGAVELGVLSVKEKVIGLSRYEDNRLTFPKPLDIVDEPVAMELADIDADGRFDCVYVAVDANETRWLRVINDLDIHTKSILLAAKELELLAEPDMDEKGLKLEELKSNPDGMKVLDADQDGLMDVLIFDKYNPPPLFARQVEKGRFELVDSPKSQASLTKEASLSSIALADVDNKAGAEFLIAQNNFARSLTFSDKGSWEVIDQYNAKSRENNISAVAAFDMTADELVMLLLDGQKGQLQILKKGADKTFRFDKELDVGKWTGAKHLKMLQAAVTGDQAESIVLFDSEKFAIITPPSTTRAPMHLEQQFSYETKIKDGAYGHLTVGEINSDDRADIIMVEYKHNHVEILALDEQFKPVPAMRFKIFEEKSYRDSKQTRQSGVEPRELKVADVTGDGKDDLVTVIHDRIIIYPQD
jgi:hypothetical protein